MRIAVYPGSFDPMTNGHVDLVRRGCHIFDRVLVAVLCNTEKAPLFSVEERVGMTKAVFQREPKVKVKAFSGLLVNFLRKEKTNIVLRGLRVVSDFEYEFQMALINRRLNRDIETVFLMTGYKWFYTSSNLIKEAASHGGSVRGLVPEIVLQRLQEKYADSFKKG